MIAAPLHAPEEVGPEAVLLAHERACDEIPTGYSDWLRCHADRVFIPYPWQEDLLHAREPVVLVHTASQMGKSLILLHDLRLYFEGRHPCQTHRPPVVIGFLGTRWNQMVDSLISLWKIIDPRWFRATLDLSEGSVKGQRNTILTAVSGPCAGGQIRLFTNDMGTESIQGQRMHRAYCDEPPDQSIYGEIRSRVFSQNGCVRLGFTPRLKSVGEKGSDLDWLWNLVDSGAIRCIEAPMEVRNLTPASGLIRVPRMTQAQIDEYAAGLPAPEREMALGRSRKPCFEGRVLSAFNRSLVQSIPTPFGARLGIGMDHGSRPGKQRVVLGWATGEWNQTRIHHVREWKGEGGQHEAVAVAVLDMLAKIGHTVKDVDFWVGDRAHGGDARGGAVSNWDIIRAIAQKLGVNSEARDWTRKIPRPLAKMWIPSKWTGSVWANIETVGSMMASGRWTCDPSCGDLIDDIEAWRGSFIDDHKDGVDAMRYLDVGIQDEDVIKRLQRAA